MFKKGWYIFLAWTVGSFYIFALAVVVISMFSPGPSEQQNMIWMQEMMNAMHNSLMGWSMETHVEVNHLIIRTSALVFPAIFCGAILGVLLKIRRTKNEG